MSKKETFTAEDLSTILKIDKTPEEPVEKKKKKIQKGKKPKKEAEVAAKEEEDRSADGYDTFFRRDSFTPIDDEDGFTPYLKSGLIHMN